VALLAGGRPHPHVHHDPVESRSAAAFCGDAWCVLENAWLSKQDFAQNAQEAMAGSALITLLTLHSPNRSTDISAHPHHNTY